MLAEVENTMGGIVPMHLVILAEAAVDGKVVSVVQRLIGVTSGRAVEQESNGGWRRWVLGMRWYDAGRTCWSLP